VGCFRLCTVQRAANMKGDTGGTEQEGEQFWGRGFGWLINWKLEIGGHIFLFCLPIEIPFNSCQYTGPYFPLWLGLHKGIERSPLEDVKFNLYPAVPSCGLTNCIVTTIYYVTWSACFTLCLKAFNTSRSRVWKKRIDFAYKSG
jgi:hypothetical protein